MKLLSILIITALLMLSGCGKQIQAKPTADYTPPPRPKPVIKAQEPAPQPQQSEPEAQDEPEPEPEQEDQPEPEDEPEPARPPPQIIPDRDTSDEDEDEIDIDYLYFSIPADCEDCEDRFFEELDEFDAEIFMDTDNNAAQVGYDPNTYDEDELLDAIPAGIGAEEISQSDFFDRITPDEGDTLLLEVENCDENCVDELKDHLPELDGVKSANIAGLNIIRVEYERETVDEDDILEKALEITEEVDVV